MRRPGAARRRAASRVARSRTVVGLLTRSPRARGRGLALLWHRVTPDGARDGDVVPTVSVDRFRSQLEALGEMGDLVPLATLEEEPGSSRPRFAVTFDDDHPSHAASALPVLRDLDVPATFFLSGRWLRGLGPYWWEHLERALRTDGARAVADRLGVPATGAAELAAVLEDRPELRGALAAGEHGDPMSREDALTLVRAGMEIGFHTLRHPVLPAVPAGELDHEVGDGLDELSADLGTPLRRFAYPHGRTTPTVTAAVAERGFVTAWTTSHRPADPAGDPHAQGRWEPGPRDVDDLVRGVLRRLHLPRPGAG